MNLIVAVDRNWGIGKDNQLLAHIPDDMKFFRTTTTGKVVVMGRKTLESFPNGKPLKNRINIVLTTDKNYTAEPAIIVHSKEELESELKKYMSDDIYVIGGASLYNMLLNQCDTALVTYIDHEYDADTYFPNLKEKPEWTLCDESERCSHENIDFYFRTYKREP